MTEGVGDPRLTAQGEVSLARLALDDGEIQHAADHVANAMGILPSLPDAHAVLATLLSHPEGGVELWPLDGEIHVGTVAARAHARAFVGDYVDALSLLVSAQGHEPETPWADIAWVLDPAMPARVDPGQLTSVLIQLFRRRRSSGGGGSWTATERSTIRPGSRLIYRGFAALAWMPSRRRSRP